MVYLERIYFLLFSVVIHNFFTIPFFPFSMGPVHLHYNWQPDRIGKIGDTFQCSYQLNNIKVLCLE